MSARDARAALITSVTVWVLAGCLGGDESGSAEAPGGSVAEFAAVTVEYIAHASFLLRASDGTEVLIDPYASRVWLGYDWPEGIHPDAILITHPHYDHDAGRFRGMPFPWDDAVPVIDTPGEQTVGPFSVTGVAGRHADPYGKEFGQRNTLMLVEAHGLRIAHLGDNGPLTDEMVAGLGRVDVLMIPGDGVDHILSKEATAAIIEALDPRIVIPMHYRLPDLETSEDSPADLGEVEPWLAGRESVRFVGSHVTSIGAADLVEGRSYLVLDHAPYVRPPV